MLANCGARHRRRVLPGERDAGADDRHRRRQSRPGRADRGSDGHRAAGGLGGGRRQVTGTIKTLGATFNSEVKEGQVLATLDPASLQAKSIRRAPRSSRMRRRYEQAKVNLPDATDQAGPSRAAVEGPADSTTGLRRRPYRARGMRQAAVKVGARAGCTRRARRSRSPRSTSTTPSSARRPTASSWLAERRGRPDGDIGLQTPTLFVIARDLGTMQVSASVDESDIGRVAVGQPVTFTTDAYGGETCSPAPSRKCGCSPLSRKTS